MLSWDGDEGMRKENGKGEWETRDIGVTMFIVSNSQCIWNSGLLSSNK